MKNLRLSNLVLGPCLILSNVACLQTHKEPKTAEKQPNIILILADDIGFETIGCYGSAIYKTPRIDKMAEQGVRFEQCYSQSLCSPSRLQIMTGKSNFRNYERWGYLNQNETTFAHILKSQGYATCIAGKWQLRGDEYAPYKAGFDEYLLWNIVDTSSTYNERYKNPRVVENGEKKKYENGEYGPQLFVNYITNFMERKKDGPFLVYYPMVLSHRPFVPSPDSKDYGDFVVVDKGDSGGSRSDTTYFKDEMAFVDKNVGEIIDKVHELGISENTLILFTGDNGTGTEIISAMKDGKKIPGMKGFTNEYGIHVPLVAYWEGKIKPGQVNSNLVDFTDFLPTLCDAAKIKLPESFITDGRSFLPLMLGESYTPREWLFCHYDPMKSGFTKARFVHNKEWKLYESGEIFNVINDPLEKNVIPESALNSEQKKLISTFREVFAKMVKVEEIKPVKEEKEKKKPNEGEDL
ncbi:MAG: sulfatase-like hydrolase/transferase [Bacteroidia bacterium]|nr:sulfatase-like hydrolase/transferase [Bacteroidia bacterium]